MLSYKEFTFPLNVYAHILCKDYGDFDYLHYGLFEQDNDQDIQRAQQRASDLFFSYLPASPCRILEVGIGLGTTLSKLIKVGYDVIGITPDAHQIHYAKNRYGDNLPVVCQRLEDFSDNQKFDVIVFQESAQYIDTTSLFRKITDLLGDNGQVIIMDELSLNKPSPSVPGLPWINDYISLGKSSGFKLIKQLDLSSQALPTDIYILNSLIRYREDLINELNLSSTDIDNLIKAAQTHLNKYHDGHYGYGLLQFKKKPVEQFINITEWASSKHEAELLDLFLAAFGHEMSPPLWHWKYQGLDTIGALVRYDGRVVAFYGGMPRAIHLFGSPVTAVQIGDVMVHPKAHKGLGRKCLFFQAATHFIDHFVGENKSFPVGFGFPSARAYRLSEQLGLYDKVGELMQVSWPALQARPSYKFRMRLLSPSNGAIVNLLWQKMAEALRDQVIGVRDWDYMQHRYLQHPTLDYQLYLVSSRFTGVPIGIIVIRILDNSIELVDIIAQPQHISTLVHFLRRLTWNLGKSQASTWITKQNATLFANKIGEITSTDIIIPNNCWTPGIPANELLDRWWLMPGDTDFR